MARGERGGSWVDTYADVQARLTRFRVDHPTWPMITDVSIADGWVVAHTSIADDGGAVIADGWAAEIADSDYAVENAETSARGRALVNLGYPPTKSDPVGAGPAATGSTPGKRVPPTRTPASGDPDLPALQDELARRAADIPPEVAAAVGSWAAKVGIPADPHQMDAGQIAAMHRRINRELQAETSQRR